MCAHSETVESWSVACQLTVSSALHLNMCVNVVGKFLANRGPNTSFSLCWSGGNGGNPKSELVELRTTMDGRVTYKSPP